MRGADHARLIHILVVLIIAGVIAFCIICFIGIAIQLIFAGIVSITMKPLEWGEP
jgi:fucose permease